MIVKTTHLKLAAALMTQEEFVVSFLGVEPTQKVNQMNIMFEMDLKEFNDFKLKFFGRKVLIEPIIYDQNKISILETLNLHKA